MNVILEKLSDNKNALRSNRVEGYTTEAPKVGKRFRMFAEGLEDPSLLRLVETSPVVKMDENSPLPHGETFWYFFTTESGTRYSLKVQ